MYSTYHKGVREKEYKNFMNKKKRTKATKLKNMVKFINENSKIQNRVWTSIQSKGTFVNLIKNDAVIWHNAFRIDQSSK